MEDWAERRYWTWEMRCEATDMGLEMDRHREGIMEHAEVGFLQCHLGVPSDVTVRRGMAVRGACHEVMILGQRGGASYADVKARTGRLCMGLRDSAGCEGARL